MDELSIHIECPGEPEAGLQTASWEIENVFIDDNEHRESVRNNFHKAFSELTEDAVFVIFSDELPEN